MDKIPKTFKKNQLVHHLIGREGNIALYGQEFPIGGITGYEVNIITIQKETVGKFKQPDGSIQIVKFPEKEKLANNEEFGTSGWSFMSPERALEKFNELVEVENEIQNTS